MPAGYYNDTGLPVQLGKTPWNKGLTKETDDRVRINTEKTGATLKEKYANGIPGPRLGTKATPETIEKLKISHTGYIMPESQKEAIGNANRGKKKPLRTEQHQKNLTQSIRQNILSGKNHPMFGKRGEEAPGWKGGNIKIKCVWCGKIKSIEQWMFRKYKRHFCDRVCQHKWCSVNIRKEKTGNWKGGISKEPYPFDFDEELKELIRFRDGYKCQKCDCPEIENNKKLTIHHIDYDKKNYKPSNLISLCNRCNSIVNFNRPKWTKYFQKKIKKIMNSNAIQLNFRFNNSVKTKSKIDLSA